LIGAVAFAAALAGADFALFGLAMAAIFFGDFSFESGKSVPFWHVLRCFGDSYEYNLCILEANSPFNRRSKSFFFFFFESPSVSGSVDEDVANFYQFIPNCIQITEEWPSKPAIGVANIEFSPIKVITKLPLHSKMKIICFLFAVYATLAAAKREPKRPVWAPQYKVGIFITFQTKDIIQTPPLLTLT
jgi:hypothetical protein